MSKEHQIGRLTLEMGLPQGADAHAWQDKAARLVEEQIMKLLEKKLEKFGNTVNDIRIDKLEISLEDVVFAGFDSGFMEKLDERIESALKKIISADEQFSPVKQKVSEAENDSELIFLFLKNGYLPWWAQAQQNIKLNNVVVRLLKNDEKELIALLRESLVSSAALLRFVRHVTDETLLQISEVLLSTQPEIVKFNKVLFEKSLLKNETIKRFIISFALNSNALKLQDTQRAEQLTKQFSQIISRLTEKLTTEKLAELNKDLAQFYKMNGKGLMDKTLRSKKSFRLSHRKENTDAENEEATRAEELYRKQQWMALMNALLSEKEQAFQQFIKSHAALFSYTLLLSENFYPETASLLKQVLDAFSSDENTTGGFTLSLLLSGNFSASEKMKIFSEKNIKHPFAEGMRTIDSLKKKIEALEKKEEQERIQNELRRKKREEEEQRTKDEEQGAKDEETRLAANKTPEENNLTEEEQAKLNLLKAEEKTGENVLAEEEQAAMQAALKLLDNHEQAEDNKLTAEEFLESLEEQFKYTDEEIFINHAGLVILHPFLIPFFKELGYLEGNAFKDEPSKHRAVYILHFLASGSEEIPEEHDLVLPKLICGIDLDEVLEPFDGATDKERLECENLLNSVVIHWTALKNTSAAGLRNTFVNRLGRLSHNENGWTLRIERLALDILLDRIPWGFSVLRSGWMKEVIFVEW